MRAGRKREEDDRMKIRAISYTLLRHALATLYGDAHGLKTHRTGILLRIDTSPCQADDTCNTIFFHCSNNIFCRYCLQVFW